MKIGCGSWGPPFCRHLPITTIGIIFTLQNFRTKNRIHDICYKSLRKWKFHWWVDFRIYDGVPPFLEWIWRNPVFLSIGGEFMMSSHNMMGFHHMMCVLPIKWFTRIIWWTSIIWCESIIWWAFIIHCVSLSFFAIRMRKFSSFCQGSLE